MMHRLARQSFQSRMQTISCFLPGTFYFVQFLRVVYVDGRFTVKTIRDWHPGRETFEQSL
jgi:hypothetical protein